MNEYIKSSPPECHPVMHIADLSRDPITFLRLFLNRLMEGIVLSHHINLEMIFYPTDRNSILASALIKG